MLIGQWIFLGIIFVIGVAVSCVAFTGDSYAGGVIAILVTVILIGSLVGLFLWYNSSTASGIRAVKDQQSELGNGIDRTIVVTAEDGREIYRYDGRCDIETNSSDYILFEDENKKRVIIYKGVQDTIVIQEK